MPFLEDKRRAVDVSMREVAMAERITFSTYRLIESGQMHVTPAVAQRISNTIDRLAQARAQREAG